MDFSICKIVQPLNYCEFLLYNFFHFTIFVTGAPLTLTVL